MKNSINYFYIIWFNFVSSYYDKVFNYSTDHFSNFGFWLIVLVFSGWIRTVLEWIYRNTKIPLIWYRIHTFGIEKFEGLKNPFKIMFIIKKILYIVYGISKSLNLIEEPTEPILSITAYDESKKARSHIFFTKCELELASTLKKLPNGLIGFKNLIETFDVLCPITITGEVVWLFIHCLGGIFGAVYEDKFYWKLTCLISKLTIDSNSINLSDDLKLNRFFKILEFLVFTKITPGELSANVRSEVDKKIDEDIEQKLTDKDIDKKPIVNEYLLKIVNSNSLK